MQEDVPPVAQNVALAEATMDPHVGLQPAFEFSGSLPCVGFPDGFGGGSLAGQIDSERETMLRNFVLLLSMEQRENAVNGTFRNCLMADRVLSQSSRQAMPSVIHGHERNLVDLLQHTPLLVKFNHLLKEAQQFFRNDLVNSPLSNSLPNKFLLSKESGEAEDLTVRQNVGGNSGEFDCRPFKGPKTPPTPPPPPQSGRTPVCYEDQRREDRARSSEGNYHKARHPPLTEAEASIYRRRRTERRLRSCSEAARQPRFGSRPSISGSKQSTLPGLIKPQPRNFGAGRNPVHRIHSIRLHHSRPNTNLQQRILRRNTERSQHTATRLRLVRTAKMTVRPVRPFYRLAYSGQRSQDLGGRRVEPPRRGLSSGRIPVRQLVNYSRSRWKSVRSGRSSASSLSERRLKSIVKPCHGIADASQSGDFGSASGESSSRSRGSHSRTPYTDCRARGTTGDVSDAEGSRYGITETNEEGCARSRGFVWRVGASLNETNLEAEPPQLFSQRYYDGEEENEEERQTTCSEKYRGSHQRQTVRSPQRLSDKTDGGGEEEGEVLTDGACESEAVDYLPSAASINSSYRFSANKSRQPLAGHRDPPPNPRKRKNEYSPELPTRRPYSRRSSRHDGAGERPGRNCSTRRLRCAPVGRRLERRESLQSRLCAGGPSRPNRNLLRAGIPQRPVAAPGRSSGSFNRRPKPRKPPASGRPRIHDQVSRDRRLRQLR